MTLNIDVIMSVPHGTKALNMAQSYNTEQLLCCSVYVSAMCHIIRGLALGTKIDNWVKT